MELRDVERSSTRYQKSLLDREFYICSSPYSAGEALATYYYIKIWIETNSLVPPQMPRHIIEEWI